MEGPDKEVMKEIDEMLAWEKTMPEELETKEKEKEEEEDPSKEEEEKEEEEEETPEKEEEPDKEEEEDKEAEEEEEEKEEDELEPFRQELEKVLAANKASEKTVEKAKEIIEEVDFLKEIELNEDGSINPTKLNEILNKVYLKAREDLSKTTEALETDAKERQKVAELNTEFYSRFPELSKYRNFVSMVGKEFLASLSEEDKQKLSLNEYLERVADMAKGRLRIEAKKQEEKEKKDKPTFPKTKGTKKAKTQKEKPSELQKEIDTMVDYAENFN